MFNAGRNLRLGNLLLGLTQILVVPKRAREVSVTLALNMFLSTYFLAKKSLNMVLACCNQTLLLLGAALLRQRLNSVIWLSERIIQTDAGPERHLDARRATRRCLWFCGP